MQLRITSILQVLSLTLCMFFATTSANADAPVPTPAQIYNPSLNTIAGNPNGKITIVEFFDYNCGYCHKMPGIFNQLISSNSNVRIVYRDYPVLGPESTYAARAALAAAEQGKYLPFHHALFSSRQLSDDNIQRIAQSLGIDSRKLAKEITSHHINRELRLTAQTAAKLGLNGVPVVLIASTPDKNQKTVNAYILTSPSLRELQSAVKAVG